MPAKLQALGIVEIKFQITSNTTGDWQDETGLVNSFSVMVLRCFQNMI